jgi:hypothetical protein
MPASFFVSELDVLTPKSQQTIDPWTMVLLSSQIQIMTKTTSKQTLIVFGLYCILMTTGHADGQTTSTVTQSDPGPSAAIAAALQSNFGSAVEASTAFNLFYVTGDFNGDGAQDIAVVVRIKERRSALPKDVRLLNPYQLEKTIEFPANPATENKLALVIIHGWKNPKPSGKFLLIGDSPILILDYQRLTSDQPADRRNLIGLMSKRGKRRKGETFPRGAKGDVILLGNQVGDNSPVYWNGRTYVWEDSAED